MHASTRELLNLRDGSPAAARVAEHTSRCDECGAELERLRALAAQLRQLPGFQPPARAWAGIDRALAQPAPPAARWNSTGLLAAAAAVAVALLAVVLGTGPQQRVAPVPAPAAARAPDAVAPLVARSQQLEALLRGLPRPAVERAATAAAIDALQGRIQLLDLQLSNAQENGLDRARTQRLWAERVQLMSSLVGVRYAERAARREFWPPAAEGET